MLCLKVLNSALKGKRFKIRDRLTIGGSAECTVRAQHKDMQPVHALFTINADGQTHVEVGCSEAHIFVNGRDVLRSEIRHQDHLDVGPLRFQVLDVSFQKQANSRISQLLSALEDDEGEIYDFAKEDLFYLVTKDPSLRNQINFTIPSKERFIDQAQQFLARLIHQTDMDELKIEAFMTCTKELILNAHRHGHKYNESKHITLRFRNLDDHVLLSIEDEGEGFNHEPILREVRSLTAADSARKRYQSGGFGGLGFQMIVRMADDLRYNDRGNLVTFRINKSL